MGNRANIYIQDSYNPDKGVYLYTHWGGERIKQTLAKALSRHQRWDDNAYLARIIFSEMIKDDIFDETGYGISATILDNEYGRKILVVDTNEKRIGLADQPEKSEKLSPRDWISMEDFLQKVQTKGDKVDY